MWYAMQIMSETEETTVLLCRERIPAGILQDLFYPVAEYRKRYQGTWHQLYRPMFPGYLFFVTEDVEAMLLACHNVPKLTRVLGTDQTPVPLSEAEVKLLEHLMNRDRIVEVSTGVMEGDQLTILSGPMQGMEGQVKRINRHKRTAVVEVPMFGRVVEMMVGLEVVEKVGG